MSAADQDRGEKIRRAVKAFDATPTSVNRWVAPCPGCDSGKINLTTDHRGIAFACAVCGEAREVKDRILEEVGLDWADLFFGKHGADISTDFPRLRSALSAAGEGVLVRFAFVEAVGGDWLDAALLSQLVWRLYLAKKRDSSWVPSGDQVFIRQSDDTWARELRQPAGESGRKRIGRAFDRLQALGLVIRERWRYQGTNISATSIDPAAMERLYEAEEAIALAPTLDDDCPF